MILTWSLPSAWRRRIAKPTLEAPTSCRLRWRRANESMCTTAGLTILLVTRNTAVLWFKPRNKPLNIMMISMNLGVVASIKFYMKYPWIECISCTKRERRRRPGDSCPRHSKNEFSSIGNSKQGLVVREWNTEKRSSSRWAYTAMMSRSRRQNHLLPPVGWYHQAFFVDI